MAVPGNAAIRKLVIALRAQFGELGVEIDAVDDEQDTMSWRLPCCPGLIFSISTHAGGLPEGMFDLQVSILDSSLENGEILFGPESPDLGIAGVCGVVERFASGGCR